MTWILLFVMLRDKEKIMGTLSLTTGDYERRNKKNDKKNPMPLASIFRIPATQRRKNIEQNISNNNRL